MPTQAPPFVPEGTVELGVWPEQQYTQYRYHNGQLQYTAVHSNDWDRNTQSRSIKRWKEFWEWVDRRALELSQPPQAEVKDEDVKLAIDYTTLKHALEEIKHILKEKNPPLEEIKEIAQNALEDSE